MPDGDANMATGSGTTRLGIGGPGAGGSPPQTGKPREVQGVLNHYLYHPAARRLAAMLAHTPITPNAVSVFGAAMVVTAGLLYTQVGTMPAILLGFALHLGWHVVDGADGDLARMTGRASPIGELVDGLCDYGGHIVLYVLLAASMDDTLGAWAWAWALAVAAGLSRAVQSIYAESQRRTYLWWVYAVPWLKTTRAAAGNGGGVAGALSALYVRLSALLDAGTATIDTLVAAAQAEPAERARIAGLARQAGRRTLPLQIALGANARTVMLGCAMLAGSPAWFFGVEAVALNALLIVSIVRQRRTCRRLAATIRRGRT